MPSTIPAIFGRLTAMSYVAYRLTSTMSMRSSTGQSSGGRGMKLAVSGWRLAGRGGAVGGRVMAGRGREAPQRQAHRAGMTSNATKRAGVGKRAKGASRKRTSGSIKEEEKLATAPRPAGSQ